MELVLEELVQFAKPIELAGGGVVCELDFPNSRLSDTW